VNKNELVLFKGGARRQRARGGNIEAVVSALALFSKVSTRGASRIDLGPRGGNNSAIITNGLYVKLMM
jgi:hypothetical protein